MADIISRWGRFEETGTLRRFVILSAVFLISVPYQSQASESRVICSGGRPKAILEEPVLRVLTLNVSHGRKKALNQFFVSKKRTYENLDDIAVLLKTSGAHLIALQEADAPSRWSGKFDHVSYIAGKLSNTCFFHGHHSQDWMATFGTALLSKTALSEPRSVRFPTTFPTKQKGYVAATLRWATGSGTVDVTVVSVHLDFLRKSVRTAQIAQMIAELSVVEGPLVVTGDLNSDWWSSSSHVRLLADELGLQVYEPENPDLGTYKSTEGKRLDWILLSPQLEFRDYRVLPDEVADHMATFTEIIYREE